MKSNYNAEKNYLHVDMAGEITMAAARQYLEEVAIVLKETGGTRILLDSRKGTMRQSSIDLIAVSRMVSESAEANCKRALVDNPGRSGLELSESISRGHGQNIRAFNDIDAALTWLLGDEDRKRRLDASSSEGSGAIPRSNH